MWDRTRGPVPQGTPSPASEAPSEPPAPAAATGDSGQQADNAQENPVGRETAPAAPEEEAKEAGRDEEDPVEPLVFALAKRHALFKRLRPDPPPPAPETVEAHTEQDTTIHVVVSDSRARYDAAVDDLAEGISEERKARYRKLAAFLLGSSIGYSLQLGRVLSASMTAVAHTNPTGGALLAWAYAAAGSVLDYGLRFGRPASDFHTPGSWLYLVLIRVPLSTAVVVLFLTPLDHA
ncbi:hypothetical protein [Kitasatospora sp. NPDC088783]|uniref:hypothetical protein n=1 Tax=Kitasatospora sp. NPDC088783 TaxID=3364077 RepID=UPI0038167186